MASPSSNCRTSVVVQFDCDSGRAFIAERTIWVDTEVSVRRCNEGSLSRGGMFTCAKRVREMESRFNSYVRPRARKSSTTERGLRSKLVAGNCQPVFSRCSSSSLTISAANSRSLARSVSVAACLHNSRQSDLSSLIMTFPSRKSNCWRAPHRRNGFCGSYANACGVPKRQAPTNHRRSNKIAAMQTTPRGNRNGDFLHASGCGLREMTNSIVMAQFLQGRHKKRPRSGERGL